MCRPTTAARAGERLGLPETKIEAALLRLESEGIVLRGPSQLPSTVDSRKSKARGRSETTYPLSTIGSQLPMEWCDRRLLARIHRLTIGKLRQEIEAVSPADFIRFLLRWQHVHPGTQLHGRDGVAQVIGQLQGLELPAPAWERDVLPARINLYSGGTSSSSASPARWRGAGCAWPRRTEKRRTAWATARARCEASAGQRRRARRRWRSCCANPCRFCSSRRPADGDARGGLSALAGDVLAHLERHGAGFLADIARATGQLPSQTEEALWELVARGLVTGDGIAGLRTLLLPEVKRRPRRHLRALRGGSARRLMPVGRWALLRPPGTATAAEEEGHERFAWQLLRRYGVVVRELLAREVRAPAWRKLLAIFRRLEARGEIRGGRFVAGYVGEQFALPEAVEALRAVRRAAGKGETALIAAADPLNLVGILTPGARVSPFSIRSSSTRTACR